jgi:hypothetical protein
MDPFSFFAAPFATFRAVWASIQGWPYFFPQPLSAPRRLEGLNFRSSSRSSTFAMSRSSYRICNPTIQTPPFFTLGRIFNLHRLKTAMPTLTNLLTSLHPNSHSSQHSLRLRECHHSRLLGQLLSCFSRSWTLSVDTPTTRKLLTS